jgi:hypothetical protein
MIREIDPKSEEEEKIKISGCACFYGGWNPSSSPSALMEIGNHVIYQLATLRLWLISLLRHSKS